jgi:hypothetical protein
MNEMLGRDKDYVSESAQRRISSSADRVLKHLLMCDEFQLTDNVSGSTNFTDEFEARGERDSRGRSLREFDLKTRLFKYPCSYLIYSDAFASLPDEVQSQVLARLTDILEGRNDAREYAHLTADMRRDILQILRDTLPEFRRLNVASR